MKARLLFSLELPGMLRLLLVIPVLWGTTLLAADPMVEGLPKLKDMPTPTLEELLTGKPRDWVVLNTDDVLTVDSVSPRPETLAKIQEKILAKEEERKKLLGDERDKLTKEIDDLRYLYVTLPDEPGVTEFRVPVQRIRLIIHHEDLMLRRLDALLSENNVDQALELLMRLQRDRPDWPGVKSAGQKILLTDAVKRLEAGKMEEALVELDELHGQQPQYPGLQERMGQAIGKLVGESLEQKQYLRAQYFLNHLQQKYPGDPVSQEFEARLLKLSREQLAAAGNAAEQRQPRQAAVLAEEAARIWPRNAELRAPHRVYTERFQRLHVGVLDLPGECRAYPLPSGADLRRQHLTRLPLFEIDRVRDGTAYYRTRFFDEWEPRDLGRQIRFTIRRYRQPYEMQAAITAPEVVTPILQRLDERHPDYDERLASFIRSVDVESPTEFTLTFRRVPPRLEPLLSRLFLLQPGESQWALAPLEDPGGFVLQDQTPEQVSYVRKLAEPDGLPKYHVAEIVEHRYDSPERVVQGLARGEVSMAPDLTDAAIRRIQADTDLSKKFFIQPYTLPKTDLLQFNPASPALRVRELRMAISYAVDRDRLLREVVLQDPQARHGRAVTTPFLSTSPARNVLVEPRRYDISSAVAMALAARKKLGTIPPLTLVVAPGAIPRACAEDMARIWRRIGLEIKVVHAEEPAPENWDILYRTVQMTEPIIEMWPFLTFEDRARISALDVYPDWLKQELVQLDRTSDQSRAIEALQVLHRHLWEDAAYVPLWEVDQFIVIRKNISGFPQRPIHCYDEIDRWSVDAWYQTELP